MPSIFKRACKIFELLLPFKGKKMGFTLIGLGVFCLSLTFLTPYISSSFLFYGQGAHTINQKELYKILKRQPKGRLKKMRRAGLKAQAWIHLLEKGSLSLDKALRKPGQMPRRYVHFPKENDVFDEASASLYYYHAHREKEKGHFHLFLMEEGMSATQKPLFVSSREEGFSHLVAISVDEKGRPFKLFTTNQWVTHENWYKASDVIGFTEKFHIQGGHLDWATSHCLNALVTLFGPQIEELLIKRDQKVEDLVAKSDMSQQAILEDTQIEILSEMPIDIKLQLKLLEELL